MASPIANSLEGGTNGTAISAANSGGTSGTAFSTTVLASTTINYSNLVAHNSTLSAQFAYAGSSSAGYIPWNFSPTATTTRVAHRVYWYSGATFTSQDIYAVRSSAAPVMKVGTEASGKLVILNTSNATIATATAALSANTWYRIEVAVTIGTTTSNGVIEMAYYLGDSLTPVQTFTTITNANLGIVAMTLVRIGSGSTVASARTQYYDDLMVAELASGFIGPTVYTLTGSAPVQLGLAGTAATIAAVTGSASLTLGLSGSTAVAAQGDLPLALGLTGTAITAVTGALPVAVGLNGLARAAVTGSIPLSLGMSATGATETVGAIPVGIGLADSAATIVTGTLPIAVGLTATAKVAATGSTPIVLGLTGAASSLGAVTGTAPITVGLTGTAAASATGSIAANIGLAGTAVMQVTGQLGMSIGLTGSVASVATTTGTVSLSIGLDAGAQTVVTGQLPITLDIVGTVQRAGRNITVKAVLHQRWLTAITDRRVHAGLGPRWGATVADRRVTATNPQRRWEARL